MTDKKAELKISGEEPDLEQEEKEEEEEGKEEKTAEKRKNRQKTEEQTEELNIETLAAHLVNHEERLRAIESWIFRLKSL